MGAAASYVVVLTGERAHLFSETVAGGEVFAEPVDEFVHSRATALLCFVVIDRKLTHVARGRRGHRAGTAKRRLNLFDIRELERSVPIERLLAFLPRRVTSWVASGLEEGGILPARSSEALADAVRSVAPETADLLDSLSGTRIRRIENLSPTARRSLAYQKEAVANALAFAGIDATSLQRWSPVSDEVPASFLDGLPETRVREDQMIVNDMSHVPGFDHIRSTSYGAAIFQGNAVRLTVILANRLPLEEQLGTDLIYYNETFKSFVMVQYKAMEDEGPGGVGFRLPSPQLDKELASMERVLQLLKTLRRDHTRDGYRLCENPFFIKLCSRMVLQPDSSGMMSGMYLPLDYWRRVAADPAIDGPRGGKRVTRENVGRSLYAKQFAELVAGSWIGTTSAQSEAIREIIRETLVSGRAVAIAVRTEAGDVVGADETGQEDAEQRSSDET